MKKIFIFTAVAALCWSGKASATLADGYKCLSICATTLIVDSGHVGQVCDDDGEGCTCAGRAGGMPYKMQTTSCSYPKYTYEGTTLNGLNCCVFAGRATSDGSDEVEATSNDTSIAGVFSPDTRGEAFFGYVDGNNKSPDAGRGNDAQAHLDACIGYSKVDTYTNMGSSTDNTQCRADCANPTNDGVCTSTVTENGASRAYGRCMDRCDCWMNTAFGKSYNCEGL